MSGLPFDFGERGKGFIAWNYPVLDESQLCDPRRSIHAEQSLGPWKCYEDERWHRSAPYVAKVLREADPAQMHADDAYVYRLYQESFRRELDALKRIHRYDAESPSRQQALEQARPYVVDLIGSGRVPGKYDYLVLVHEGDTVMNTVRTYETGNTYDSSVRIRFALSTLRAFLALFRFIHNSGPDSFIHGDVKPDNILCARGTKLSELEENKKLLPDVKIIDFGHRSNLSAGLVPGTEEFAAANDGRNPFRAMAMYRLRNNKPGERTIADDYFALAVTTYVIFTGGPLPYILENGKVPETFDQWFADEAARAENGICGMLMDGKVNLSWKKEQTELGEISVPKPLRALWDGVFPFVYNPERIEAQARKESEAWWAELCAHISEEYSQIPPTLPPLRGPENGHESSAPSGVGTQNPPWASRDGQPTGAAEEHAREAAFILSGFIPRPFPLALDTAAHAGRYQKNNSVTDTEPNVTETNEPVSISPALPKEIDELSGRVRSEGADPENVASSGESTETPDSPGAPTQPTERRPAPKPSNVRETVEFWLGIAAVVIFAVLLPNWLMLTGADFLDIVPSEVSEQWHNTKWWWSLATVIVSAATVLWVMFSDVWHSRGAADGTAVLLLLALPWTVIGGFVAAAWTQPAGSADWFWGHWIQVAVVSATLAAALVLVRLTIGVFCGEALGRQWWATAVTVVGLALSAVACTTVVGGERALASMEAVQSTEPLDCTDPYELAIPSTRWCVSRIADWVPQPPLTEDQFAALPHPTGALPVTVSNAATDRCPAGSDRVSIWGGSRDRVLEAHNSHTRLRTDFPTAGLGTLEFVGDTVLRTASGLLMFRSASFDKDGTRTTEYGSIGPDEPTATFVTVVRETTGCGDDAAFEKLMAGIQARSTTCVDYEQMDTPTGVPLTLLRRLAAVELCVPSTGNWKIGPPPAGAASVSPGAAGMALRMDEAEMTVQLAFSPVEYGTVVQRMFNRPIIFASPMPFTAVQMASQIVPGVFDMGAPDRRRWLGLTLDPADSPLEIDGWISVPADGGTSRPPSEQQAHSAAEFLASITAK